MITSMTRSADLLAAYDKQLRVEGEIAGAATITQFGPLFLLTFPGGRGFITYRDLNGLDSNAVRSLVPQALSYFEANPSIGKVEWKTRAHDQAPGLHTALSDHGFTPDEPESIMLGEAQLLASPVTLPAGVAIRQVTLESDVRAMGAMQAEIFGNPVSDAMINALLQRIARKDGMHRVAEAAGRVVSAGQLDPVAKTAFAGIWGGSTRPEWRGYGIYRALTAARARSALKMGKTLIHSDSTEYSRPILERAGFVKVSTTTPYNWQR